MNIIEKVNDGTTYVLLKIGMFLHFLSRINNGIARIALIALTNILRVINLGIINNILSILGILMEIAENIKNTVIVTSTAILEGMEITLEKIADLIMIEEVDEFLIG